MKTGGAQRVLGVLGVIGKGSEAVRFVPFTFFFGCLRCLHLLDVYFFSISCVSARVLTTISAVAYLNYQLYFYYIGVYSISQSIYLSLYMYFLLICCFFLLREFTQSSRQMHIYIYTFKRKKIVLFFVLQ